MQMGQDALDSNQSYSTYCLGYVEIRTIVEMIPYLDRYPYPSISNITTTIVKIARKNSEGNGVSIVKQNTNVEHAFDVT